MGSVASHPGSDVFEDVVESSVERVDVPHEHRRRLVGRGFPQVRPSPVFELDRGHAQLLVRRPTREERRGRRGRGRRRRRGRGRRRGLRSSRRRGRARQTSVPGGGGRTVREPRRIPGQRRTSSAATAGARSKRVGSGAVGGVAGVVRGAHEGVRGEDRGERRRRRQARRKCDRPRRRGRRVEIGREPLGLAEANHERRRRCRGCQRGVDGRERRPGCDVGRSVLGGPLQGSHTHGTDGRGRCSAEGARGRAGGRREGPWGQTGVGGGGPEAESLGESRHVLRDQGLGPERVREPVRALRGGQSLACARSPRFPSLGLILRRRRRGPRRVAHARRDSGRAHGAGRRPQPETGEGRRARQSSKGRLRIGGDAREGEAQVEDLAAREADLRGRCRRRGGGGPGAARARRRTRERGPEGWRGSALRVFFHEVKAERAHDGLQGRARGRSRSPWSQRPRPTRRRGRGGGRIAVGRTRPTTSRAVHAV